VLHHSDGKDKHECRLVFHGTKSTANIDSIMKDGFKLNKVGSATDKGWYGKQRKSRSLQTVTLHHNGTSFDDLVGLVGSVIMAGAGAGIYFSEQTAMSQGYAATSSLILCKLLLGA
jgi:hypothetical protein